MRAEYLNLEDEKDAWNGLQKETEWMEEQEEFRETFEVEKKKRLINIEEEQKQMREKINASETQNK